MLVTWRATPPRLLASLPVEGAIRAVAARRRRESVQVVSAIQHPQLGGYLVRYDLAPEP